jgi:hypothetical protein
MDSAEFLLWFVQTTLYWSRSGIVDISPAAVTIHKQKVTAKKRNKFLIVSCIPQCVVLNNTSLIPAVLYRPPRACPMGEAVYTDCVAFPLPDPYGLAPWVKKFTPTV